MNINILLILLLFSYTVCFSRDKNSQLDYAKSIVNILLNKNHIALSENFADKVIFDEGLGGLGFEKSDNYSGFQNKKGYLFTIIYQTDVFKKNTTWISFADFISKHQKETWLVTEKNTIENKNEDLQEGGIYSQSGNLCYFILFICRDNKQCRIYRLGIKTQDAEYGEACNPEPTQTSQKIFDFIEK